jgi:DNA-directed RNA polymerase subunit M/transcription elongation factor TFIIS
MVATTIYNKKCDNCGKNNPEIYVEIKKENNNNELTREYWCVECMHEIIIS